MKLIYNYCMIVTLCLWAIISCKSNGTRLVTTLSESDSVQVDRVVTHKNIYSEPQIKYDTVIDHYHIKYLVCDNDEIIVSYPIIDGKGLDTAYYYGREVIIDIMWKQDVILHQTINKTLFTRYISQQNLPQYSISYFCIKNVNNDEVTFNVSICIPETDICYWFDLHVNRKGELTVVDITQNGESEED